MPQILCVACFKAVFQLDGSNALLVILISDYGLLLEKTIILFENQIQTASTSPCLRHMVTDFVSLIYNLKTVF